MVEIIPILITLWSEKYAAIFSSDKRENDSEGLRIYTYTDSYNSCLTRQTVWEVQ